MRGHLPIWMPKPGEKVLKADLRILQRTIAIAGFGELEADGHIARFFCHKDFQRQGVGSQILNQIEAKAKSLGLRRLFVEASLTARPFFEKRGFQTIYREEVERRGQTLIRFQMEKSIDDGPI